MPQSPAPAGRESLSAAQARRLALAAQGFLGPRPVPGVRALRKVAARLGLFQIDSVNVLVRSHYLPLFSRVGAYPRELLDRAAYRRPLELFEYWGHEASLVPVGLQPYLRWRMAAAASEAWPSLVRLQAERPGLVAGVLAAVADRGPVSAGELEEKRVRKSGPWWDWHDTKRALEWLFRTGEVTTAGRRNFERLYDLPGRVLPAAVLAEPTPSPAAAHRELVLVAARAMGVATEYDLRDYFRLRPAPCRAAIAELVEAGALVPVRVQGWQQQAYLDPLATVPRRAGACALLSPFDSLVWERARTERIWNFRYRLEIYTPAPKRVYGYYVLPFLLGDALVARVDLKADRQAGVLRVPAVYSENGRPPGEVAEALAPKLAELAQWLGLGGVAEPAGGDLAPALTAALRAG
jgi:uncharacterized protein YcaQ